MKGPAHLLRGGGLPPDVAKNKGGPPPPEDGENIHPCFPLPPDVLKTVLNSLRHTDMVPRHPKTQDAQGRLQYSSRPRCWCPPRPELMDVFKYIIVKFGSLGDSKASKTPVAGLKKSQQQSMRRLTVQRGGGYAALALGQLDGRWVPSYPRHCLWITWNVRLQPKPARSFGINADDLRPLIPLYIKVRHQITKSKSLIHYNFSAT